MLPRITPSRRVFPPSSARLPDSLQNAATPQSTKAAVTTEAHIFGGSDTIALPCARTGVADPGRSTDARVARSARTRAQTLHQRSPSRVGAVRHAGCTRHAAG